MQTPILEYRHGNNAKFAVFSPIGLVDPHIKGTQLILYMPNLFYNLVKMKRDKQRQLCQGVSHSMIAKESPVFDFLESHFANNSIGTTVTYTAPGKSGQRVYHVYEKTMNGFLLIKRNFFAQNGTLLKSELPAQPKNM